MWPVRSRTPPARAFSGMTWPPTTMSSWPLAGSTAVRIVCARSAARMPVVTPSRASMVTVNGVWCGRLVLQRHELEAQVVAALGRERQADPARGAWVAMKLMSSAVTNSAAMTRSPSFSRSSSSTTTTMRPAAISSSASSTVANWVGRACSCQVRAPNSFSTYLARRSTSRLTSVPGAAVPRLVRSQGLGDEGDGEARVVDGDDGQRDAVDGDRALLDDVAQDVRLGVDA